jgi:hypothetical protein
VAHLLRIEPGRGKRVSPLLRVGATGWIERQSAGGPPLRDISEALLFCYNTVPRWAELPVPTLCRHRWCL